MKEKIYNMVAGATLAIILIMVGSLVIITFWPLNPAKFYSPVVYTPVVKAGDLFNYDMVFDKYTNISPSIQRTLVCGNNDNAIVLQQAIGVNRPGKIRVRNISVEIPRSVLPNRCRLKSHVSYSYFGGLRSVEYEVWTDYFQVVK